MRNPSVLQVSVLLLATALPGQRDLAKSLPAHTWAYVGDAGLDATAKTFHDAKLVGLGRDLLGDEGWVQVQNLVRERAGRDFDEALNAFQRVGLDVGRVRALLAGPFALAAGRLTFMGDNLMPSIALLSEVKDADDVKQCLRDIEGLVGKAAPSIEVSDATVAGVACRRFTLPGGMGSIVHGLVDDIWIATNSEGFFADSVAALRGQVANLATNMSLTRGRKELQGTRLLEVFVNLQQLSASVTPLLPYEVAGVGQALGASDLPDLYLGTSHDGKGACDVIHFMLPGAKSGLLKAALSTGASNAAARWVKPSTSLFASMRVDVRAAMNAWDVLVGALPPAAANQMTKEGELKQAVARIQRQATREIKRELGMNPQDLFGMLASLGSEISIAIDTPKPTPPFVTATLFVELADVDGAKALLDHLAASGQLGAIVSEDAEGGPMWSTDAEIEGLKLSPSWGIRDGWLVASNFKNVVQRLLRDGPRQEGSLAEDPRFVAAAKAADGASMFVTARFNPVLQNFWGLAMMGIQAGADMIDLETDEIPSGDDVAGAIDDLVMALRVDEHGFVLRQQHPLAFGALLSASAAGLDWFLKQAPRKIH